MESLQVLTLLSAMALLTSASAMVNHLDLANKGDNQPFQKTMTYAEAMAKELIQGDPEICVGAATGMPSSKTAYGCCMGTGQEDACFISSPEVAKILKDWFKRDEGDQYLSSWHGISKDRLYSPTMQVQLRSKRQVLETTTAAADSVTTVSSSTSIHDMDPTVIKDLMSALANQTSTGLSVCYSKINEEVEAMSTLAASLEAEALTNYVPALVEICPTKTTISYGTFGEACDSSNGEAKITNVSIAQGVHYVNPQVSIECDWGKIHDSWVSKTMCGITCKQVHRLESFITQENINGTLQIKWNRVKVPSGCKAFLQQASALNRVTGTDATTSTPSTLA